MYLSRWALTHVARSQQRFGVNVGFSDSDRMLIKNLYILKVIE